jgi:deoxynucleoside triphosphate triphosphohydrolase SAMHD1
MLPAILIRFSVCQQAEKEDISLVVPEKFGEVLMQVYTKEEKFMGLVQAAYLHVFRSLPIPDDQSEIATIEVMTP